MAHPEFAVMSWIMMGIALGSLVLMAKSGIAVKNRQANAGRVGPAVILVLIPIFMIFTGLFFVFNARATYDGPTTIDNIPTATATQTP